MSRLISMSASGRFVVIRKERDGVPLLDVVDALGTAPRAELPAPGLVDFCCLGDALWTLVGRSMTRRRLGPIDEVPLELELEEPASGFQADGAASEISMLRGVPVVVLEDEGALEAVDVGELGGADLALALSPARIVAVIGREYEIRDRRRGVIARGQLPGTGRVVGGAVLFAGKALCFQTDNDDSSALDVVRPTGALVHHIEIEAPELLVFARGRGAAIAAVGKSLAAIDLRYGRVANRIDSPVDTGGLAIDDRGAHIAIAGTEPDNDHLAVLHVAYATLFSGKTRIVAPTAAELDARADASTRAEPAAGVVETEPELEVGERSEPEAAPEPIPPGPLHALRTQLAATLPHDDSGEHEAYPNPSGHIEDLLDLIAARVGLAIARAWDSGRLSAPGDREHPFETEVLAILGQRRGGAGELVESIEARCGELARRVSVRTRATLAARRAVPLVDVAAQFGLDPVDTRVLTAVAAPALRGEIARLYGVLANDSARPLCDAYLVETLLCADEGWGTTAVRAALQPDAPLLRNGLVQTSAGAGDLFAPLAVDPVLLSRLQGLGFSVTAGSVATIERSERRLEDLAIPHSLIRECVDGLREPMRDGRPARLVVAGRRGSGRTSLIAALAERSGLPITVIEAERIPRTGLVDGLRSELRRAALRGTLPVVSGLSFAQSGDDHSDDLVRDVLRCHPGPLAIRTARDHRPPLDPGYIQIKIPSLRETERLSFWREAVARRGLVAARLEELAARFRIGPGTIESIIDAVLARLEPERGDADVSDLLDRAARQHIDGRLGAVAHRVKRLARWEQVALPDYVLDSVREFIGRVRHRRTVYDEWGFDKKLSTSRGLSALFYGPPGTGKTMVAGLIARELGLDLYRVDLARITSKWIGETEKNLAEIFDAAEDGQAIILFDEADSLFARRTEVKSSVDRYANLEVNYLLQRLDTFEGLAVLTTNFEGALDRALKRRLSLRLAFPFPDEEMRVRLWASHIPAEVPTAGAFDFEDLARRFPMSGGYIRNSALRAAFLAAQEDVPLSQRHLERVIELEYSEMGKLSRTGRLE